MARRKARELGPQGSLRFVNVQAEGSADVVGKALGLVPEDVRAAAGDTMRAGFKGGGVALGRALGGVGNALTELGDGVRAGLAAMFGCDPADVTDEEVAEGVEAVTRPPAEPRDSKELGRMKRDHALEVVERGAPDGWMDAAVLLIERTARLRSTFTSDDVWEAGLEPPPEPRALGAAFTKAVRLGYIERTGTFTTTRRSSRHAAPIAVWRSRICERDCT